MTARIDVAKSARGVSVRVLGHLDGAAARELLDVCRRQPGPAAIDVEELESADRAAVEALRELRGAGARIVGASPYTRMLLSGRYVPAPAFESEKEDG